MNDVLGYRSYFKPFDYEWAFEAFLQQEKHHWLPEEIPLHEDVQDFNNKLTDPQKHLITHLFRFFTQADVDVAEGYYDVYLQNFKLPELRMMLGSFASMEGIHQHAYASLIDTIGMPESEYKAFFQYKEMVDKHEYVANTRPHRYEDVIEGYVTEDQYMHSLALSLAVYSAFTEGMQLFSSFAILLNFSRQNLMKNMCQVVTYSVRDETIHVENMIRLFRTLIKENPHLWTDQLKKEIYDVCRTMVHLEDQFIDLCFQHGGVEGLTPDDIQQYIRYIADRRLLQLGLKPNYGVKDNPLPWLEWVLNAPEHQNFFEGSATEYTAANLSGSWDSVWKGIHQYAQ